MNREWLATTEVFDAYERRFAIARAQKRLSHPWEEKQRREIVDSAKRMLRYDETLVPKVHAVEEISKKDYGSYTAVELRYQTWEHVYGVSTLYIPKDAEKPPLVFVCCGHGQNGRLTGSYAAMAHRLASLGMAVLVMDNIGQGDRNLSPENANGPDHWMAVAPFQCGLTLQGLIVMETVAVIRYIQKSSRFGALAACGNSGGGTLTMFLAALAPELSVIASSGYPSEAAYILQKERRHCACNLLIGQAFEAEMWELYSVFAPKPLLLEGGDFDHLIPMDLAHRNARKVRNTYVQLDADENFTFVLTATKHSWDVEDVNLISRFLSQQLLGMTPEDEKDLFRVEDITPQRVSVPKDCLTTAQLAQKLSGKTAPPDRELADVFPPVFEGKLICPDDLQLDVGRGDVMRVFAQMECALYKPEE